MSSYTQKRVLVLYTGGTIAGNVAENANSESAKSTPDDFQAVVEQSLDKVKETWGIEIKVETQELFNEDSSNVASKHWTIIAAAIEERYDDFDSFIILHGTNTMGYSAAALSFALSNTNKPVVFTGAQVPLGHLGSDAVTNVVNALRFAVWEYHNIKGVFAVFGSKIISGVRVKKGTDFDYDPFRSFITGSIGEIGRFMRIDQQALENHVAYLSKSKPLAMQAKMLSVFKDFDTASLASLTEVPGMKPDLFANLVENSGIKGFILRAFGAGDASSALYSSLEYLKQKKIPIVITSQAPTGVASFQVNETGKYISDHDLAIPAYDMSIESMTTKMAWLLAQNKSYEEIKQLMVTDLHGEINVETEQV